MNHSILAVNLLHVRKRIDAAIQTYHRLPGTVQLLAVTKGATVAAIQEAYLNGQRSFGENYLQEALEKITALADFDIEWHFIGRIQRNKTQKIAAHFNWVHSLCSQVVAERLNAQRPIHLPPLQVCIEVNVNNDPHKAGVSLAELGAMAQFVSGLSRLSLRGLMMIPEQIPVVTEQRQTFHKLHKAFIELRAKGFSLDTLSMGMSADLEAAIAEGATVVRVGRALFNTESAQA